MDFTYIIYLSLLLITNAAYESKNGCCKHMNICDSFDSFNECNNVGFCYWDRDCECDECCINISDNDSIECQKYSTNRLKCIKQDKECKWICDGSMHSISSPPTDIGKTQCCNYLSDCEHIQRTVSCDDLTPSQCLKYPTECFSDCNNHGLPTTNGRKQNIMTTRTFIGITKFEGKFNESKWGPWTPPPDAHHAPLTIEQLIVDETPFEVDVRTGFIFQHIIEPESFKKIYPYYPKINSQDIFSVDTHLFDTSAQTISQQRFGPDERWQVAPAYGWPFRATVFITYQSQSPGHYCTGFLVGPRHVLTAGSCLHSGGKTGDYYSIGYIYPAAAYPMDLINQEFWGVKYWSASAWVLRKDRRYNYGMILLNKSPNYWMSFGYKEPLPSTWNYHSNGYPSDKLLATMWHTNCSLTDVYQLTFESFDCDFDGRGTSGSGMYFGRIPPPPKRTKNDRLTSIKYVNYGIHSHFTVVREPIFNRNVAVRITKSRYFQICDWINDPVIGC